MDRRYQVAFHGQVTVFQGVFNKLEVEREQVVQHAQRPIKLRCSELRVGSKSGKYGMITNAALISMCGRAL
jgi:hypothetical protein